MAININTRNLMMKNLLGGISYTAPTTWYLGLSTTDINSDGTGITEPASSTGYARVAIPNNSINWSEPSLGIVKNKLEYTFPEITVSAGTATNVFLSDSLTGNAVIWKKLSASEYRILQSLSTIYIKADDMEFSLINEA